MERLESFTKFFILLAILSSYAFAVEEIEEDTEREALEIEEAMIHANTQMKKARLEMMEKIKEIEERRQEN